MTVKPRTIDFRSPLTTYRQHRCHRDHRTYRTWAHCVWPRAAWIGGEGPYALVARCRAVTVSLWWSRDEAEKSKELIDKTGCSGICGKSHEVIRIRK